MRVRRRLTMQLTPLLDLLLIVIFAQFMDVREREATTIDEAQLAVERSVQAETDLAELQSTHQRAVDALEQAASIVTRLRTEKKELSNQQQQLQSELDRSVAQQRVLGELVTELFNLPDSVIAEVLTPEGATNPAASAEQREFLEARFRELSLQNAGRMIRHLLSFEEMRKRCDLWELHIDNTGWFTLRAGSEERGFRATSPREFSDQFYSSYKSLPESKSLVVIMLSYGDARADVREAAIQGLPRVTDRMREDRRRLHPLRIRRPRLSTSPGRVNRSRIKADRLSAQCTAFMTHDRIRSMVVPFRAAHVSKRPLARVGMVLEAADPCEQPLTNVRGSDELVRSDKRQARPTSSGCDHDASHEAGELATGGDTLYDGKRRFQSLSVKTPHVHHGRTIAENSLRGRAANDRDRHRS